MFYRTNNPQSYRRSFYLPGKRQKESTSPLPFAFLWDFDNSLVDYSGALQWAERNPGNTIQLNYLAGIIGSSLNYQSSGGSVETFSIVNPGSLFEIIQGANFAIGLWFYLSSYSQERIGLSLVNSGGGIEWIFVFRPSNRNLFFAFDDGGGLEFATQAGLSTSIATTNNWHYIWLVIDGSDTDNNTNNPSLTFGFDSNIYSKTYGNAVFPGASSYTTSYELRLWGGAGNIANRFDQLSIWHTELKTNQDMLDLYNSGAGSLLP